MSKETLEHLNTHTLIGYTEKRGTAWHYRAEEQGDESNHYPGAIPIEAIKRRLFDWQAVEGEITATHIGEEGVLQFTDPERKAIMRSDTGAILGIFKSGYRVHQFDEWLVHNVEDILDANLQVGSAGVLKGGAQAWVQIEMPETMEASEGVQYRPFLTAATSMDGSIATTYGTGAQLVVCDNTLSVALGSFNEKIKIRHSRNSLNKIGDVRDALNIVHQVSDIFEAQVAELTSQYVSDQQWKDFVKAFTQPESKSTRSINMAEKKASELNRLWNYDVMVAPWKNNAFGVLTAVNTHAHHFQTVRGASRAERNMDRAITGGVDKMDNLTLKVLASVS